MGNRQFYALAIQRHGHNLGETIVEQAEKIIGSAGLPGDGPEERLRAVVGIR